VIFEVFIVKHDRKEYTHAIKLTEKQIKQLIQILGGVEPIAKLEAQTMKIWTFTAFEWDLGTYRFIDVYVEEPLGSTWFVESKRILVHQNLELH
jgi:hypothetical protein